MPFSLVDLRPDRHLLNHEFEGYKLNLQTLSHFGLDLPSPVDKLYPDEVQYSFVHAKLFALHNHLIFDFWDHQYNYYYNDNLQQVRNVTFDNINNTFQSAVVYDVPAHVERKSGHFNLSLTFPSNNLAVVSDGTGYIHIVETGTRNRPASDKQTWQTLYSTLALGEDKYFTIVDTRMEENDNVELLHCLLQSVEQSEKHFDSVLSWITFENYDKTWKQSTLREVRGKGIIHYAALETSCTALYVASDNLFKFTVDSEKDIIKHKEEPRQIIYTWLQTSDDITITLKLQNNFDKKLIFVNVTPLSVKISYAGKVFVEGKLSHNVDCELTTWNVEENGQVDILITKSESQLWNELLAGGDKNGEQILDASLVEEVHKRLAHLCSETEVVADQSVPGINTQELEECDAASEEDTVLTRMDITSHEITHKIPLSVHQYLFNTKLETHEAPALALRHDVDACIWQPYAQLVNSNAWPVKHHGTLTAFGYVQSSKQNRKFVTCSPSFSYSVVCEATRHIFIYKSSGDQDCQLRKKTGGVMKNIKVGQQHVVNIDKYGEVLGIHATNDYLFILTENKFVVIEI
ncbi:nudC domain-containing protein 1 [Nymphalis io]|uniref:nudC domain-containing protein 1 n=1 Tax=Inachis io TaxID=171585 RepID=UPI002167A4EC|nr:nudC domain-containing protein 1 [Nymphalis io]